MSYDIKLIEYEVIIRIYKTKKIRIYKTKKIRIYKTKKSILDPPSAQRREALSLYGSK